ncbi:MAG: fimbrillin family protein [Prevotellaceae bacterium]|jgi:hypothetical protein|nr:fimbrillin family protein [Prevotellaceae bacterium]
MKTRSIAIYAAALALLALAACSREVQEVAAEKPQGKAVGFTDGKAPSPSGGVTRSAGDVATDNLNAMAVYAHYTAAADFDAVEATSTPNFMFEQPVAKSGGSWTYAPQKYWPAAHGKVSFFAIAPVPDPATNGISLVDGNAYTGYPSFTVTPPASPALQQDVCVAAALNLADNTDDGKVPLHFDHVMAKVTFSAKYTSDNGEALDVELKQLKLSGIYSSNTLHLTATGFTWDTPDDANKGAYTLSVADNTLVGTPLIKNGDKGDTTVSTDAGTLMLAPQTVSGATLEVTTRWVGNVTEMRPIDMPEMKLEAGKSYKYNLTIDENSLSTVQWDWEYTGGARTFTALQDGDYRLEAWGAGGAGSTSGNGAYVAGEMHLKKGTNIYVYVGQSAAGFNGGGGSVSSGVAGGGATDFRLLNDSWNNSSSLNSRILVAGGGGGGASNEGNIGRGGNGGGLTGYNGGRAGRNTNATAGRGGEQTSGGAGVSYGGYSTSSGSFGAGSAGRSNAHVGGGGGGYYGGSGAARQDGFAVAAGGGGGSSFISGKTNCVAIVPTSTGNPREQDSDASLNYNSAFGASLTWSEGEEIIFTNTSMIDGAGREWNTGATAGATIGMPNWNGGGTMTGNTGHGHARITLLQGSP